MVTDILLGDLVAMQCKVKITVVQKVVNATLGTCSIYIFVHFRKMSVVYGGQSRHSDPVVAPWGDPHLLLREFRVAR
jgi:hypothetical protein